MNKDDTYQEEKTEGETQKAEGRTCVGYLWYTSGRRSKSGKPGCFGVSRRIPEVPEPLVRKADQSASEEGLLLERFYFGCLGISVVVTGEGPKNRLPVCSGFKTLYDIQKQPLDDTSSAPAEVHTEQG